MLIVVPYVEKMQADEYQLQTTEIPKRPFPKFPWT